MPPLMAPVDADGSLRPRRKTNGPPPAARGSLTPGPVEAAAGSRGQQAGQSVAAN